VSSTPQASAYNSAGYWTLVHARLRRATRVQTANCAPDQARIMVVSRMVIQAADRARDEPPREMFIIKKA